MHITSPRKKSKFKVHFLLNVYGFCPIINLRTPTQTSISWDPLYLFLVSSPFFPLSVSFFFFFLSFIFISWKLITFQYCSGFCHTLTRISHGFTCVPHPDPPSHLPLHPIPLGLPSAPALSACFKLDYPLSILPI